MVVMVVMGSPDENWGWLSTHFLNRTASWEFEFAQVSEEILCQHTPSLSTHTYTLHVNTRPLYQHTLLTHPPYQHTHTPYQHTSCQYTPTLSTHLIDSPSLSTAQPLGNSSSPRLMRNYCTNTQPLYSNAPSPSPDTFSINRLLSIV